MNSHRSGSQSVSPGHQPLEPFWEERVCGFAVCGKHCQLYPVLRPEHTSCPAWGASTVACHAQCVSAIGWVLRYMLETHRREESRNDTYPQRTPSVIGKTHGIIMPFTSGGARCRKGCKAQWETLLGAWREVVREGSEEVIVERQGGAD